MQSNAPLLRIGTRGSALALTQAGMVQARLALAHGITPDQIEIVRFTTSGDRITDRPLSEAGGKGLFTKEIEEALLRGTIDLAVHSGKDLATTQPDALTLTAFLEREDARDAFVSFKATGLHDLAHGATMGTSSIRRAAQMLRARPDLRIVGFRGNVDTRLRKLAEGVADATILAVAGLNRLGRASEITAFLDPERFPPAPAQGAIALQTRTDDRRVRDLVMPLDDQPTHIAVRAERAMLAVLDGSCRTPIGVLTSMSGNDIALKGELLTPDGREEVTADAHGPAADPEAVGHALGHRLLEIAGPHITTRFGT